MNENKSKLLWIAVIGLLILNFSTLAFIWFHHPPEEQRDHHNVAEFLIHELNLNKEQVSQFNDLKSDHHEKIEQVQNELHKLHHDFFDLIKSDSPDTIKVNSIAIEISLKQQEMELITFNHFKDVRKICDANQKQKFDSVIDEALQMMAPGPPGPPGMHHP